MKMINHLLLTLFTSSLVLAAPPQNHRSDRYKDLYLNSPMTDEPIKEDPIPEVDELPDWVLVGVTKYVNSTKVQIMNIKDRTRLVIPSKEASEAGFSVKEVVQDRNYLKNTVVTLQKGKSTGEVRFDPKFLVLKKVAGPTAAKSQRPGGTQNKKTTANARTGNQPPTPPGVRTSTNKANGGRTSPAKPGTVPQPTTSTTTKKPSTSSSSSTKRTRYVPRPKK